MLLIFFPARFRDITFSASAGISLKHSSKQVGQASLIALAKFPSATSHRGNELKKLETNNLGGILGKQVILLLLGIAKSASFAVR